MANQADKWGSLKYNINHATGFLMGAPTPNDIFLYSDLVWSPAQTTVDYVTFIKEYTDLVNGANLTGQQRTRQYPMDVERWQKGDWFIAGQTWLPWFAPPVNPDPKADPVLEYYTMRTDDTFGLVYNQFSMPVLKPTLMSVAKLVGIGIGSYYGVKYGYRAAVRYSKR